jgi:hypothetical protein
MRPDYVQAVHMAHEGFVARATGVSKFGARAPGKRYKLLRNRLAGIGEGLSGGRENIYMQGLRRRESTIPTSGYLKHSSTKGLACEYDRAKGVPYARLDQYGCGPPRRKGIGNPGRES